MSSCLGSTGARFIRNALNRVQLETLIANGYPPAVVVETRRDCFDVWLKLSDGPLLDEVRAIAVDGLGKSQALNKDHDQARTHGRLAGLTNHDAPTTRAGWHPYVKLRAASAQVAPAAAEYLERIGNRHAMEREAQLRKLEHMREMSRSRRGGPQR